MTVRTSLTAIDGTHTVRWYFPGNDCHVITGWEPGVGYLAHVDGGEENGTGIGPTRLSAIADLAEILGLSE